MTLPTFNTKSPTIRRILKEAHELRAHPDPTLHAAPLESNLFEWHFTLRGPPSTVYGKGTYHGRVILPPSYPLRPPSFRFLTPSGRFEVNREICLSISGHHEETWQPAWGIRTALWALRAFMEGDAKGQVGGMEMPKVERERLAEESRAWRCAGCGGRSNEEILREEGDNDGEGKEEPAVPDELKFGFRDQMSIKNDDTVDKGKAKEVVSPPAPMSESATPHMAQPIQPARAAPIAAQLPPATSNHHATTTTAPRTSSDGVPLWVDKAITGVVAALVLMIIKKILI
ncbi:MAG: hypothetical protein Q9164_000052 [Protoblastenia rupestris]